MSRDADRPLAHGQVPARCVAKVDCRVAPARSLNTFLDAVNRSRVAYLYRQQGQRCSARTLRKRRSSRRAEHPDPLISSRPRPFIGDRLIGGNPPPSPPPPPPSGPRDNSGRPEGRSSTFERNQRLGSIISDTRSSFYRAPSPAYVARVELARGSPLRDDGDDGAFLHGGMGGKVPLIGP